VVVPSSSQQLATPCTQTPPVPQRCTRTTSRPCASPLSGGRFCHSERPRRRQQTFRQARSCSGIEGWVRAAPMDLENRQRRCSGLEGHLGRAHDAGLPASPRRTRLFAPDGTDTASRRRDVCACGMPNRMLQRLSTLAESLGHRLTTLSAQHKPLVALSRTLLAFLQVRGQPAWIV
jgi:hypothetical protein